jgi:hypothetical protein
MAATQSTRRVLVRVLLIEAVTLGLLWLLQAHYLR